MIDTSYVAPEPPPPPLPLVKAAFTEGSLSIRFVGEVGIDYRVQGGTDIKAWNTLADWKEGTGQEVQVATNPDLANANFFMRVEARPD